MTRRRAHVLVALVGLACSHGLAAQQAPSLRGSIVTATVEPETLAVGQPFVVRIRVRAPKIATIRFPAVPDSGDAIEAVDPRYVEDASDNTLLDRTAVYGLVAWDVGAHRPHFANVVISASGLDQQFPVSVSPVMVTSLLPADTALRVPKDAKEPVAAPSGLWRYLLLGGIALLAAVWYLVRRVRRRRRVRAVEPDPEAFEVARAAFKALDELALVEAGESGRHVIAHVDVMRAYVARRFPTARESLTARELVLALKASDLPISPDRIAAVVEHDSDVRYAHAAIAADEASAIGRETRAIVQNVQDAYEERLRAADKAPSRTRRGKKP